MTPDPAAPAATLVAVTVEAKRALDGASEARITRFPFKVGRESRLSAAAEARARESRLGLLPELNDLYLLEPQWSDLMRISREHFTIEYDGRQFWLVDRHSACGTIVGSQQVGGNRRGGRVLLRPGDTIAVGPPYSEYVFRFEVAAAR